MHRKLIKNLKNMEKFKKLVELAKSNVENYIIEEVGFSGLVFLPTNGEELIWHLGSDWYFEMLLRAGYGASTIDRKVDNEDYGELASALDDWYKTEMFTKLYNKFKSEGRKILDVEGREI